MIESWVMTLRKHGVKYLFVSPKYDDFLGNIKSDPNAVRIKIGSVDGYLIPLTKVKLLSNYDRTGTPLSMVDTDGYLPFETFGSFDPKTYEFKIEY